MKITALLILASAFLAVGCGTAPKTSSPETAKVSPPETTKPAAVPETLIAAGQWPDYGVQPGDVLEISVWREKDLQREVLVRPDGGLTFPLVGDIQAAGKTVEQLRTEITKRLVKYIPDPVVTVAAKQIQGNKIYVVGKVNRPGEFVVGRNVDVMQALSVAGGATPFASLNRIKILRRVNGTVTSIPFKYGQVEGGHHLKQNILLQSGDVVVVP